MAKKEEKKLYAKLRSGGVRKKTARSAAKASSKEKGGTQKAVSSALDDLKGAVSELESRVKRGDRKAAARKAARTRKAKAKKRSAAAKRGARKRAKATG